MGTQFNFTELGIEKFECPYCKEDLIEHLTDVDIDDYRDEGRYTKSGVLFNTFCHQCEKEIKVLLKLNVKYL